MLFSMLSPIATAIMSEIPPDSGNAATATGVGGQQLPAQPGGPAGGTPAPADSTPAGGVAGVDPNAPAGGQPSPPLANIPIEDGRFYVTDPARPTERVMGLQLKEALHRGMQVDTLQSQLHTTLNQNRTLLGRAEQAENRLAEITRQQDVAATLASMGVPTQQTGAQPLGGGPAPPVQPTQTPGVPQTPPQGTEDPALALLRQQWAAEGVDTAGAFGFRAGEPGVDPNAQNPALGVNPSGVTPGVPAPGVPAPPNQPVPQTQNPAILDPQQFAQSLMPVLSALVKQEMQPVLAQVQTANVQGLQQLRQEWANRDTIASTFDDARSMRSQTLIQQGVPEEQVRNILDLEDMTRVLERQAEGLMDQGNIEVARQKLAQAGTLQQQAIDARTAAQVSHQSNQAVQQFQQNVEHDAFAAHGVERPQDLPEDLKDPKAIQDAIANNFNKAAELVEARDRIDRTAGVM